MAWVVCVLVVGHVARSTSRVRGGQIVVSTCVALCAGHRRMEAGQGPAGAGVIECPVTPGGRVMALLTGLREPRLHVARVVRALIVGEMARYAQGICTGQGVVPVNVALTALQSVMRTRQGESRGRVIEDGTHPTCGVVALLTGLREIGLNVTGVIRVLEVREVAGYASCAGQIVVSVDVALGALHSRMRASQGESGLGVIELCRLPCPSVVALLAGLRESLLHVVRIGRALEVLEVTGHARRCRQIVVPVNVTLAALHSSVRTS